MNYISLSALKTGETAVLHAIRIQNSQRFRLQELGFFPGQEIRCAYIAPGGSPMAFWAKGALIALRTATCDGILVEAIGGDRPHA